MMRYRMVKKRRRQALTDYRKRVALLMGSMPRIVIRKSNRGVTAQIVAFQPNGDRVLTGVTSSELKKLNWMPRSNTPTAYLTGLALAKKAKKLNLGEVVVDTGLYKPGKSSILFAAVRGAADGGLKVLNDIKVDEKRIRGEHISGYAKLIKQNAEKYNKQFSGYGSGKFVVERLDSAFDEVKKKIMSE